MADTAYGYCQCGCGEKTPLYNETRKDKGWVKGEPWKYLRGHVFKTPFHKSYDASGGPDACWEWKGARVSTGYGSFGWNGRTVLAHRHSYEVHNGPIPPGLHVCHACDNPSCVNPRHLWLGTAKDNMSDKSAKGRARGKVRLGADSGFAKLDEDAVREIRRLHGTGEYTNRELARQFDVTPTNVGYIVNRQTWKHI